MKRSHRIPDMIYCAVSADDVFGARSEAALVLQISHCRSSLCTLFPGCPLLCSSCLRYWQVDDEPYQPQVKASLLNSDKGDAAWLCAAKPHEWDGLIPASRKVIGRVVGENLTCQMGTCIPYRSPQQKGRSLSARFPALQDPSSSWLIHLSLAN